LIFAGEKVTSTAKPAEGVVVEQLRHVEIILPSCAGRVLPGVREYGRSCITLPSSKISRPIPKLIGR
jgi:hypothetical protein